MLRTWPEHPLPDGPETPVVIAFEAPTHPIGVNDTNGHAYRAFWDAKKQWERCGLKLARDHAALLVPLRGRRVELFFRVPLEKHKDADSQNFVGGV